MNVKVEHIFSLNYVLERKIVRLIFILVLSIQLIVGIHLLIKNMIRFAAYRDHPPEDETYITISNPENLTNATSIL